MSDFHEVLFPVDISYGSGGGPKWKTAVWAADSGFEARVSDWSNVRAEYDVSMGIRSEAQASALTDFFMNRRGRAFAFRFKDWNDFEVDNVALGLGDYATRAYQIKKTYRHASPAGEVFQMTRALKKVEWGSETGVKIDGVAITRNPLDARSYALNYNTGVLTFSEPPRGGLYAGATVVTPVDMITVAEGGQSSALRVSASFRSIVPYDAQRGWAVMLGVFGTGYGLRKVEVASASETLQRSAQSIHPDASLRQYTSIICVDGNGYAYINTGGFSNGVPILKVDVANLNYVTHWGVINNDLSGLSTSHPSGRPGVAALDNKSFLHISIFGRATLHDAETCVALARVLDVNNFEIYGACPYRDNGYAIGYRDPAESDVGCALYIYFPGHGFKTFSWGSQTARITSCHYDKATGGVLVFWEGERGQPILNNVDSWCGLWHENQGGWVWKRPMPQQHGHAGLNNMDSQAALNGVLCWITQTARYFGTRMWRLETATGLLQSRACGAYGDWLAYDPGRNLIVGASGNVGTFIASTDVSGVAMQPPEVLSVDHLEYHVGVRFDTDHLNMKHDFWTYRSWESIPLIEVRNWDDLELD